MLVLPIEYEVFQRTRFTNILLFCGSIKFPWKYVLHFSLRILLQRIKKQQQFNKTNSILKPLLILPLNIIACQLQQIHWIWNQFTPRDHWCRSDLQCVLQFHFIYWIVYNPKTTLLTQKIVRKFDLPSSNKNISNSKKHFFFCNFLNNFTIKSIVSMKWFKTLRCESAISYMVSQVLEFHRKIKFGDHEKRCTKPHLQ